MSRATQSLFAAVGLVMLTVFVVSTSASAATVFNADFDGTTVADLGGTNGYGAQITEANLNAGTSVGTWTVNQAQDAPGGKNAKMIQTDGGANVTEKALRFGISTDGTIATNTPVLTANLTSSLTLSNTITVSFDYGIISFDTGGRTTYLTGLDGSGNRLFQVGFVNSNDVDGKRMGYVNTAGAWTPIGSPADLIGNNNTFWDADLMKNVTIEVGASSYDISLAGSPLATDIAFRDAAASGLSTMAFSASTKWTGGAFDNLTVEQNAIPAAAALPGGLALMGAFGLRRRRA